MRAEDIAKSMGSTKDHVVKQLEQLETQGEAIRIGKNRWMSQRHYSVLREKILAMLGTFHEQNPLRTGISGAEIRSRIKPTPDSMLFEDTLIKMQTESIIIQERGRVRLFEHKPELSPDLQKIKSTIDTMMLTRANNPPDSKEILKKVGEKAEQVLEFMIETGDLKRLDDNILFHREGLEMAKKRIQTLLLNKKEATISEIRQHLETTRKYAVPLMIYFDTIGFTERVDDKRRLREE
jgi:selenocysteine-specific elongation factor